jgi:hypothetical protein
MKEPVRPQWLAKARRNTVPQAESECPHALTLELIQEQPPHAWGYDPYDTASADRNGPDIWRFTRRKA